MKNIRSNIGALNVRWSVFACFIIIISFSIIIILLLNIYPFRINCYTNPEFWAILVGSCVAIANALLLYATLNSQNHGIENEKEAHRQERFETTFFNLLESQRKLTEEISANSGFIDECAGVSLQKIDGRRFFSFAINEMKIISKSLKSNINSKYDEKEMTQSVFAHQAEWEAKDPEKVMVNQEQEEWKKLIETFRIEYCNWIYNIVDDDKKNCSSNKSLPYTLFINKWYPYYEHFIRNLYYILQYVYDENHLDEQIMRKYINFIQSQMSRDELKLIEIHANSFPIFREMLDKTHFTEILI